ncbi:MAG: alpha/beta hydrolase family protein [Panacagrimonas sp.]
MAAQQFEVTASDGHRFGATLYPASIPSAPLLLFLSAMGTRAHYYAALGEAMAAAGVSFASCDWRGIDTSSQRASRAVDFGYRHLVEMDIPAAVSAVRERLPQAPFWIGGHSLGGQLSTLYASREPDGIEGLVIIAAGTVHFSAYGSRGGLRILALTQSAPIVSTVFGHFPGRRIGFAGREARGVMSDWARVARSGRFNIAGSRHDYEASMSQLEKPVLVLGFDADNLAPAMARDRLISKLPKSRRMHLSWSAAHSGGLALDHFSWAKRPDLVVPTISRWVLENTSPASP